MINCQVQLYGRLPVLEFGKGGWYQGSSNDTAQLKELVVRHIEAGHRCIVFDLHAITRIDSHGLGMLAASHLTATRLGGSLILVLLPGFLLESIQRIHLDRLFPVFSSVEEALLSQPRE
jgi:anti-anti-sigma factor